MWQIEMNSNTQANNYSLNDYCTQKFSGVASSYQIFVGQKKCQSFDRKTKEQDGGLELLEDKFCTTQIC